MWGFSRPVRPGYWFAPRRYGFGFTPANRMGWAVTCTFLALFGLAMWVLPDDRSRIMVGAGLIGGYLAIALLKTDGGWGWHWGD